MNLVARGGMKLHAEILEGRKGTGVPTRSTNVVTSGPRRTLVSTVRGDVHFALETSLGLPARNFDGQFVGARLDGRRFATMNGANCLAPAGVSVKAV